MKKKYGKLTFLEEYDGFLLIKQDKGPVTVVDLNYMRKGIPSEQCRNSYDAASWEPQNVSYVYGKSRFVCSSRGQIQVWQLGPTINEFKLLHKLKEPGFGLQSIKFYDEPEEGLFFLCQKQHRPGGQKSHTKLKVYDLTSYPQEIAQLHDSYHSLYSKPIHQFTSADNLIIKYCQGSGEVVMAVNEYIFAWVKRPERVTSDMEEYQYWRHQKIAIADGNTGPAPILIDQEYDAATEKWCFAKIRRQEEAAMKREKQRR